MNKYKKLPALTLTELMVVLVIIGILILLALPNLTGLFAQAYSLEAQKQLQFIHTLQQSHYQQHFRYSDNLQELRFEAPTLKQDNGNAVYRYSIVSASKTSFIAKAEAAEDFDQDGTYNVWEIDQTGIPRETQLD